MKQRMFEVLTVTLITCMVWRPVWAQFPPSLSLERDRGTAATLAPRLPDPRPQVPIQTAAAPMDSAGLDAIIRGYMSQYHIAGLAAVVVSRDNIVWHGAYGHKDAAQTAPVADTTLFNILSLSQTVLTTGVLQLWEHGRLDLDADISNYLPFQVVHYYYPSTPISTRMLLSHVSGIGGSNADRWVNDLVFGADSPIPLEQSLRDFLVPGGIYYRSTNFPFRPGSYAWISPYPVSIMGLMIEHITGMPLEQYFQDSVFAPLGMHETSFFLANLDSNHIAMPLSWDFETGQYVAYGHLGSPLYPDMTIRTSSIQLAHHLSTLLCHGIVNSVRVLDSTTVDSITTINYPNAGYPGGVSFGLGWWRFNAPGTPAWVWGDNSTGWGCTLEMFGLPSEGTGIVVLSNSDVTNGHDYIRTALLNFARDLDHDGVVAGLDNCTNYNPGQEDTDNDGLADACDNCTDTDGDGFGNPGYTANTCVVDNCPTIANPSQQDANHDGIGDACCCLALTGNIDCDLADGTDISDLSALIDNLYISLAPLCCPKEANVDGSLDGNIDISDLSGLIDFLYISFTPPAACM